MIFGSAGCGGMVHRGARVVIYRGEGWQCQPPRRASSESSTACPASQGAEELQARTPSDGDVVFVQGRLALQRRTRHKPARRKTTSRAAPADPPSRRWTSAAKHSGAIGEPDRSRADFREDGSIPSNPRHIPSATTPASRGEEYRASLRRPPPPGGFRAVTRRR